MTTPVDSLTSGQQGIYTAVNDILGKWGLQSLAPDLLSFVQKGYDAPTVQYMIRQTDAYKQRFAGNDLRVKNGYAALPEGEYLALERGYKDAARAYNLPSGFYDNPQHAAELIGKDISANEFAQRANYAFKYTQQSNPAAMQALQSYYGVNQSQITAYFMDPDKAQALLDKQAATVDLGAAAFKQGITDVDRNRAEQFVGQGVSQGQAERGFQDTALALNEGQLDIAKRFGSDLNQTDLENEFVGGLASAARKRQLLNQQQEGLFAANADSATRSFAQDSLGGY